MWLCANQYGFIAVPRLRRKQWCLDTPDLPLGSTLRQRVVTHFKVFMVEGVMPLALVVGKHPVTSFHTVTVFV